jgi:hypothetical protein
LDPHNTRTNAAFSFCGFVGGDFESHPGILRQMMARGIAAAEGVEGKCGSAFFERLAEKIDAADSERHGSSDACAAPPLHGGLWRRGLSHVVASR